MNRELKFTQGVVLLSTINNSLIRNNSIEESSAIYLIKPCKTLINALAFSKSHKSSIESNAIFVEK